MKVAKTAVFLALACLCLPFAALQTPAAPAARPQAVRPGLTEALDACGLRIKTFRDSKAIPPRPLDCRTAKDPKTGETVEVYPGPDYWRQAQMVGEWSGAGASLMVLEMKHPVARIPHTVSRDSFAKWAEENKLTADQDASEWIKAVSGLDLTPGAAKLKGEGDVTITPYEGGGGAGAHVECYLVQSAKAGRTLLCVYEFDQGKVDVERSKSAVKASVQSVGFFAPKTVTVKQQPNSAVNGKRKYSSEFLASKQKVIDNIKNLKGWWYLETENYLLVSNQKNRQAVDVIRKDMEKARTAFEAVYPVIGDIKAVSVIRVPATRAEYLEYVGPELKWSGGVWMPSKNELVISDSDWGDNRSKAGQIREVLFHEGFHQYLSYAISDANVWFNEGHARFFEGLEFTGSTFRINPLPNDSAAVMRMVASGKVNLQKMFDMSYQEFYCEKGSEKERSDHYSLAWGIVYYMNKGALCSKKTERYAEIPLRYYLTVIRTHDTKAAMVAAFDGVEIPQLEKDFLAFWKEPSNVRRSASQPFVKERMELLKKLQKLPEFAPPADAAE